MLLSLHLRHAALLRPQLKEPQSRHPSLRFHTEVVALQQKYNQQQNLPLLNLRQ